MSDRHIPPESLLHRGVGMVEFFDLSEGELANLQPLIDQFAQEGRDRFSFHAPIARPQEFPYSGVTCFYLSEDDDLRELSFDILGRSLAAAAEWGAEYVVTHLSYGPTDSKDPDRADELAQSACRRMAEMSANAEIPLDLEFAAYTDSFNRAERFAQIIEPWDELGICLDVGHAFVGAAIRERDFYSDLDALLPKVRSAHLWNSLGAEHTALYGHTPLHPSQRPAEGWIDIEAVLDKLLIKDNSVNLVFEYPIDRVTEKIQEGYDWVETYSVA